MIPGPIEVSDGVAAAAANRPPSHVSPAFIEAFGAALEAMRVVWRARADAQPFVVAGSGTLAMESAATNVVDPGDRVLVVNSGYFSDRMVEMLTRRGATVSEVIAPAGSAPRPTEVREAVQRAEAAGRPFKALFATHVDTSTGVRVDAEGLCAVAREHGLLSVFDGVCATAGERFEMAAWGADVYLSASQKALGAPPGLAVWVASARALAARDALTVPPPMVLDWHHWLPIVRAYEARNGSYFATPATTLVLALKAGLDDVLGLDPNLQRAVAMQIDAHARAAAGMRAAWEALGLRRLPREPEIAANTLSALYYPEGADASLVKGIAAHGVIVAGGLHPDLKTRYFRVGHMGVVVHRPEALERTVRAVGLAMRDAGLDADVDGAVAALRERLTPAG